MARRSRGPKAPKVKVAKFDLINPDAKPAHEPYKLMAAIRKSDHPDTLEANIALAWVVGNKHDADGYLCLGKCVKASDLQKELAEWDFVILLNKEVWQSKEFTVEKKNALLDHELMHVAEAVDKNHEPKVDAKGRRMWRVRRHDLEEFTDIVRRHGIWKKDLERFADAIMKRQTTLFPAQAAVDTVDAPAAEPQTDMVQ